MEPFSSPRDLRDNWSFDQFLKKSKFSKSTNVNTVPTLKFLSGSSGRKDNWSCNQYKKNLSFKFNL
jgi:hypothetical protein